MKLNDTRRPIKADARGITLIELLVLVAIVAILAALFIPTDIHKGPAQGALCVNNLKQLSCAWALYAQDNGDRLIPNIQGGGAGGWVQGSLAWKTVDGNTNYKNLTNG